jgi:hypothetical protein
MKLKTSLVIASFAMSGCGQQPASPPSAATPTPTASARTSPPPKPTPEAWRAAFDSSYHMIGKSVDGGDGITKFDACFDPAAPAKMSDCDVGAAGKQDAFRKLWIFMPRLSGLFSSPIGIADQPYVSAYVSVKENQSPRILYSPHYIGGSWLVMTSMAIMVDGDIVLEHNFDRTDVQTHVGSGYVEENSDFALTDKQVVGLRKIHPGSKVIIRLTGKNGFVSMDHGSKSKRAPASFFNTKSFSFDVKETLGIYDAISAKTRGKDVPGQL